MGAKPPAIAAVISFFLPGVGHFYAGAWPRGFCVLVVLYAAMAVLVQAGGYLPVLVYAGLILAAAYDAYRSAERENLREAAETAAGPAERTWIHWVWGLMRAAWISVFFLVFGGAALAALYQSLRVGNFLGAATVGLPAVFFFALSYLAGRSTYRVLAGTEALSPRAVRNEIGSTVFIVGILVLLFMIVAPGFKDLYRKSAEGALKGRLGTLRQAIDSYRAANHAPPPSLEALVDAKLLVEIPAPWPRASKIKHSDSPGTILLPDGVPTDSGKWAYTVNASSPGFVFIDCTHTDTRGSAWASY